jgi:hypothetical protein
MSIVDLKTKNFDYQEFFKSTTAERNGFDNQEEFIKLQNDLQDELLSNAKFTISKMQEIRDLIDLPIKINSGWRSKRLNQLVGGRDNSQHMKFQACDWRPIKNGNLLTKADDLKEFVLIIKSNGIEIDQCLVEETWIHTSFVEKNPRNQFGTYLKNSNGKRVLKLL